MSVSKTGQTGQRFLGRFAVSSTCRSLHKKTSRTPKTHKKQKRKSMENSQRNDSKSGKIMHEFTDVVKRSSVSTFPTQNICNVGPTTLTRRSLTSEKICRVQDKDSSLKNPNEGPFISHQKLEAPRNTTDVGNTKLLLSSWGLPEPILQQYHLLGIREMFQWQAECLSTGQTLNGGNLVFSAPTSAGKTMVAELLIFKRVLETKRKAIMILPFVSVAHEKVQYFKFLCDEVGIRVGGFLGSQTPRGGFKNVDIAVCTIEKGNSLVNRLLEEKQLDQLGVIVVDELHMIGDSHRGYLLELMLTKILFSSKQNNSNKISRIKDAPSKNVQVQIIGMSATLPNLQVIAKWLDASLYTTNFRPVPLTECVKIGQTIFNSEMVKSHELNIKTKLKDDADHIVSLCLETVSCAHSVLIFCPTKLWCEKLADNIAREFYHILRQKSADQDNGTTPSLPIDKEATHDIKVQLEKSPAGLDFVLGKTVQCGVAFHHAGLTFDEREIIESAFRVGILKVLVATSTLSSGVNLPARRVIIRSLLFYGQVIDARTYKQMVGRAGRKGVDTEGESILICKVNEKPRAYELLNAALPPIKSSFMKCYEDGPTGSLKRAILEIIASGAAVNVSDVSLYSSCTLLAASVQDEERRENNINLVSECIDFLKENEFISIRDITKKDSDCVETIESCFFPTQLGSAVLASSLAPEEGLHVFTELQRARRCFVLENELHILYLVTPIYNQDIAANLDWYNYYCLWEKLDPGQRRVAELVGVEEGFIAKAIRGYIPVKTSKQLRALNIHKRFYTCLCLNDLVQEMPLSEVVKKYTCNKGQLQSLQQSAGTFAGMVTVFCARLGWTMLEVLLSQFHTRLTFGIQPELCDLVRISLLNGQQARLLFSAGYTSISDLATADAIQLEFVLHTGTQFQSNKQTEDETEWEALKRLRKSRCIWLHGCQGMTAQEAALIIIKEAKHIIEDGLGGVELKWNESESVSQVSGLAQTTTCFRNGSNASNLEMNLDSNLIENPNLMKTGNQLVDGNNNNSQSVTNLLVSNSNPVSDFSTSTINQSTNILKKTVLDLQEKQCSENLNSSQEFIENNTAANHLLSTTYKSTISKPEDLAYFNARTISPVNSNNISESDITKTKNRVFSYVDDVGRDKSHQLNTETKPSLVKSSSSENNKTENLQKFGQNLTMVQDNVYKHLPTSDEGEFHDQLKTVNTGSHVESSDKSNPDNPVNSTDVDYGGDVSNLDIFGDSFELDSQMLLITEKNVNEQKEKVNNNEETSPVLFAEDRYLKTRSEVQGDKCIHFGKQSLLMTEDAKEIFENSCFTIQDKEKSPNLEIFQNLQNTYEPNSLLPGSCHERIAYDENLSFHNSSIEENDLFLSFEENEKRTCSSFDQNKSAKDFETDKYINQSNEDLFTPLSFDIMEKQNCSNKDEDMFGESLSATLIEKLLPAESKNGFEKKNYSEIIKVNGINSNASDNPLESQNNVTSRQCHRNLDKSMVSIKKRKRNSSNSETSFSEEKSEEVNLMKYDNSSSNPISSSPSDLFSLSLDLSTINTPALFQNKDFKMMAVGSSSVVNKNNDKEMTGEVYSTTKSSAAKGLHSKKTINADCHSNTVLTTTDQFTESLNKSNMNTDCLKTIAVDGIENLEELLDIDQQANNKVVPLCDPSQPCSQEEFTIIDVCSSHALFETFIAEWLTKPKYALSIGCENLPPKDADTGIGANFMQGISLKHLNDKDSLKFDGSLVVGFAVCWNKHDAYYIALTNDNPTDEPDDSLAPPPLDTAISIDDRLQALRKIFTAHSPNDVKIIAFDAKATYRAVTTTISVAPRYTFIDPKIASWLLDPGAKESNFHQLIFSYLPSVQHILDDIGGSQGHSSLGLTPTNTSSGRRRCTTEAVLIWHLMKHLEETLIEEQLYEPFINVEMPFINTISRMELNGFGFNIEESEVQKNIMQAKISALEEEAYSLSGHPFSLSSTDDISKVLYLELQLPVNGNPNTAVSNIPYKTLGPKRRIAGYKSPFSTSKQILEKLKVYHRLPGVILEWRQITNSLTKVVFPLLKAKVHLAKMNMYRIFSICQLHTATGRISMFDPNLQNIPRDFQIDLPDVISETPVTVPDKRKSKHHPCKQQMKSNCGQPFAVSMRNAFVPFEGGILVAADYSQLELRIIAHLSKDEKLITILNKDCDVFKLITSEWKNIPVEQVTDKQRQQAKQICYGMIYGIGAKALGETLNIEENDATVFMETFKSKYPGMKSYIQNTVKRCRQDGYVKTITGRKRYLPNINSPNSFSKLQAERQAVNTTVQGSAADLMKIAMVNIDNELIKLFPASSQPHTVDNMVEHTKNGEILLKCRRSPRNQRSYSFLNQPSGAYLLLQIHDELIYEVGLYDLRRAATIIQTEMESAMKLSVRLPVKLKSGPSWGKLDEIIL